jgi:hypothetical protein
MRVAQEVAIAKWQGWHAIKLIETDETHRPGVCASLRVRKVRLEDSAAVNWKFKRVEPPE